MNELAIATDLIAEFEGLRLKAYRCPAGVWTIGIGTTRYPGGQAVKRGDTCTEIQARFYMMAELMEIEKRLRNILYWDQMNENQRAALYSFAYNLGAGFYHARNFTSISTLCDMQNLWRDGEYVRRQFDKYVRAGGKTLTGLVRRRAAEAKLWLTEV